MSLKFCANLSFMFQETSSFLERYHLARQAGFKAVECAFPYEFSIEDVIKAKELANVEQVLINVYPGNLRKGELGFAAILDKEDEFQDSIKLALQYAKGLGCKLVHIMSGIVEHKTKANDLIYERNLKLASLLLEKEKIVGVIEPINSYSVPNYYLNDFDRAIDVIKKINSPYLKLQLDVFHLQLLNGNLTRNIKSLLPYIAHVQVAQVPNRNEPNTPGEINYDYIFSLLKEKKYSGYIGLEYTPALDTILGLKWIKEYKLEI